jgi:4-amino-4-deoxychorismate lyase
MEILVNGQRQRAIEATDRGLLYGDGLFETMRVLNGRITLIDYHLERLLYGCERLRIELAGRASLLNEIRSVARELENGVVKLIITRGTGGRGYAPPVEAEPTRILMTTPLPRVPGILGERGGIRVRTAGMRLARQPTLAGVKHLNRLEQVLARAERGNCEECLMLDTDGNVIEGSMTNVFLVENARLVTPDLSFSGVAGVMRRRIIELAESLGLGCVERVVDAVELKRAGEMFMCNSVRGIWPVIQMDRQPLKVGATTRRLERELAGVWP